MSAHEPTSSPDLPVSERLDFDTGPYASSEVWLPRLHKLIRDQMALARRLGELGDEARRAVEHEEAQGLHPALDQRDAVLREMGLLAEDIRPSLEAFGRLSANLTDEQRRGVQQRIVELDEALALVAAGDEDLQRLIERRRGELGRELAQLASARSAAATYGASAGGGPAAQSHDAHA